MKRSPGHASVEEHPKGSGKFRVRQRVGKSLKTLGSGLTQAAANELADAVGQVRRISAIREGITLEQFGVGFLDRREMKGVRSVAKDRTRWNKHVARAPIGAMAVSAIVRRDVVEWRDSLPGAFRSKLRNLNLLKVALDDAVERELLQSNPAREVKLHRSAAASAKDDLEGILTPNEQQRLMAAVPPRERPLVAFALVTGLRQAEQWWLHWEDVQDGVVVVRRSAGGLPPKSGKPREVPLLPPAIAALASLRRPRAHGIVFNGGRGCRRQEGKAPLLWPKWVKAAGIKRKIRWHDLRHTCATSLLAGWWGRKWTLDEVCKLMGHSSITVTERYARKLNETLRLAVSETPMLMFPSGNKNGPNMPELAGKPGSFVKRRSSVQVRQSAPVLTTPDGEQSGNRLAAGIDRGAEPGVFVLPWLGPQPPPSEAADFAWLQAEWGGR